MSAPFVIQQSSAFEHIQMLRCGTLADAKDAGKFRYTILVTKQQYNKAIPGLIRQYDTGEKRTSLSPFTYVVT